MIKTSILCSIQAIILLVRNSLIVLVVLLLALFMVLLAGVKIDTLKVGHYHIGGLYIKLNKKLTLRSDYIILPRRKAKPSFGRIDTTFDEVKYLLTFFEHIELKRIQFDNMDVSVTFHNDSLHIATDDYALDGSIHRVKEKLHANITSLYLKKMQLQLQGTLTYDLKHDILKTKGVFEGSGTKGSFRARKVGKQIYFDLASNPTTDIHAIIDQFGMNKVVRVWVLEKIEATQYQLKSLSGSGEIRKGRFVLDLNGLKGEVDLWDVKIHFKEHLAPVLAPKVHLQYRDGGLYFALESPYYEGISLEGSHVGIENILNDHTNLKLAIYAHTGFDQRIQTLLSAYRVHLPLGEKSTTAKILFKADLGLKHHKEEFEVNADFDPGDVWIQKVKLPVTRGNVHYQRGVITLRDVFLKDTLYEGDLNGTITLAKERADLHLNLNFARFTDEGEILFEMQKEHLPLVLEYANGIDVTLPSLEVRLHNESNRTVIVSDDLSKLIPYVPHHELFEDGGTLQVETKDFENYQFRGVLKRHSCFLYEKNNRCKVRIPVRGSVTQKDLKFYAFGKRLYYQRKKSRVKLNKINIDLQKFFQYEKEKQKHHRMTQKEKKKRDLLLIGKDSHLRYGKYRLLMDSYDITIKPSGDIKAIGSAAGDIIKFSTHHEKVKIEALRITDKILHPLIHFSGLQNGRYSLTSSGIPEKSMKGKVIVEGGVMKNFVAYNNTLAFINTLPALAVLHNPGFSNEGFTIEEGVAEFRHIGPIDKGKVIFDSIYIKGTAATIVGKGEIDLKKETITMNLAIRIARELGSVIGSLPLVGYILMGEDKSMTVGLKITGSLESPEVSTSGAKAILLLPLGLIRRTLESPLRLLTQ